MQLLLAFELWIASLALVGMIGWALGERNGAKAVSRSSVSAAHLSPRERVPVSQEMPRELWKARHRGARPAAFRDMPTLEEVSVEARTIRSSVNIWEAPDIGNQIDGLLAQLDSGSVEVLNQFRASVDRLAVQTETTTAPAGSGRASISPRLPRRGYTV